jgi:hypothetical protein
VACVAQAALAAQTLADDIPAVDPMPFQTRRTWP